MTPARWTPIALFIRRYSAPFRSDYVDHIRRYAEGYARCWRAFRPASEAMTSPHLCQARAQSDGSHHCVACRIAWDRDDEAPPCPRSIQAPSIVPDAPLKFASGLSNCALYR